MFYNRIMLLRVILTLLLASNIYAQDERRYRKIISGDLRPDKPPPVKEYFFKANSPMYELDLNGDDRMEYIVLEKKDNEDWIHIHDYLRNRLFSAKFTPKGSKSGVYKINLRKIAKNTNVLLLHYYEGYVRFYDFLGTSRLYVLTIHANDLKKMSLSRGPVLFEEKRELNRHYHKRPYKVSMFDFDGDGIREITVRHHLIERVMKYQGKGRWTVQ